MECKKIIPVTQQHLADASQHFETKRRHYIPKEKCPCVSVCVWLWWKEIFNDIAWAILSVCQLIARLSGKWWWVCLSTSSGRMTQALIGCCCGWCVPWLCFLFAAAACTVCCILTRIRQIDCAIDTLYTHGDKRFFPKLRTVLLEYGIYWEDGLLFRLSCNVSRVLMDKQWKQ